MPRRLKAGSPKCRSFGGGMRFLAHPWVSGLSCRASEDLYVELDRREQRLARRSIELIGCAAKVVRSA
jgi:hypothetical protein